MSIFVVKQTSQLLLVCWQ